MIRTRSIHFAVLIGAFVGFSALVASGATFAMDDGASRYFKGLQGNPSIDAAMLIVTSFGDATTLFVIGIVLIIIRRTRKVGMIFLIALVVLVVLVMYIKPVVGRHIPPYGFSPPVDFPENFGLEQDSLAPGTQFLSYPSGHASRTTALAFIAGFALYNRSRIAGYVIWVFPVVMGITRLYVMQHYPTDIVGGMLLGLIVSVILSNAMKLDQPFSMSRFKGRGEEEKDDRAPAGDSLPQ